MAQTKVQVFLTPADLLEILGPALDGLHAAEAEAGVPPSSLTSRSAYLTALIRAAARSPEVQAAVVAEVLELRRQYAAGGGPMPRRRR